jgi:hypothetical protein
MEGSGVLTPAWVKALEELFSEHAVPVLVQIGDVPPIEMQWLVGGVLYGLEGLRGNGVEKLVVRVRRKDGE